MKITPTQRKALEWFAENEPISAFPCDGIAPSLRFVRRLRQLGLVEEVGKEPGMWGFTKFARTKAGRDAIAPTSQEQERAAS